MGKFEGLLVNQWNQTACIKYILVLLTEHDACKIKAFVYIIVCICIFIINNTHTCMYILRKICYVYI